MKTLLLIKPTQEMGNLDVLQIYISSDLPTNCLSVFDHFVKLALKGLTIKRFKEPRDD